MKMLRRLAAALPLLVGGYWLWARTGRSPPATKPRSFLEAQTSLGTDSGRGNLVAVQPFMEPDDYRSAATLLAKLDTYMRAAADAGWLRPHTVVIFPEHIGTWLVAAGEKEHVYQADTLNGALIRLVAANLPRFLATFRKTVAVDRTAAAVFRLKATRMAERYQTVFCQLARRYGVTIVAGSIVLPDAHVSAGQLRPGPGPLYNCSVVFDPSGTPLPAVVRKVHPTKAELPFTAPAPATDLPVFDTPAGRAAVLICADSWYPDAYASLKPQKPDFVVAPNYVDRYGMWDQPWGGYDPGPMPADVNEDDINRLTEGEAWLTYALPGRLQSAGARIGMHVYLHGNLWDMTGDGRTLIVRDGETWQGPHVVGAALVNYWLPPAG